MNAELKPCPFCGFVSTVIGARWEEHVFYGYCAKCQAKGPVALDKETATEFWNERREQVAIESTKKE